MFARFLINYIVLLLSYTACRLKYDDARDFLTMQDTYVS